MKNIALIDGVLCPKCVGRGSFLDGPCPVCQGLKRVPADGHACMWCGAIYETALTRDAHEAVCSE